MAGTPAAGDDWGPAVSDAVARTASAAAIDILQRVVDDSVLTEALAATQRDTHHSQAAQWEAPGLAQGHAGIAVAAGYAAKCGATGAWDAVAHRHLTVAAVRGAQAPLPPGLFAGLAGILFATNSLAADGRYRQLTASVRNALDPAARDLTTRVIHRPGLLRANDYDVVSGLSGIAAALLDAAPSASRADPTLSTVLGGLIGISALDEGIPRLVTRPGQLGTDALRAEFPSGMVNIGLAHGAPAPLAALSIAALRGHEAADLHDTIDRLAHWIADEHCEDDWGINWPYTVALPLGSVRPVPSRAAWCYGAPGVARSLWLAGRALEDEELREIAVEAMRAVYRRPRALQQIASPTLCHGTAGLLVITLRFAHETGLGFFRDATSELVGRILESYSAEGSLLGIRAIESSGVHIDQPGVLDGAAGTAMALLAASHSVHPDWDRMLLVS